MEDIQESGLEDVEAGTLFKFFWTVPSLRSLVMASIVRNIQCYGETQTKGRLRQNGAGLWRVASAEQMASQGTVELSNPNL